MDQEKSKKMSQSPNSNITRDTAETIKQIQKQGLSISIVSSNIGAFSLPTTAPDIRPKLSTPVADKTSKISPRSLAPAEKPQIIQAKLVPDPKYPPTRAATPSSFQDINTVTTPVRANQPKISEIKSFTHRTGLPTPPDMKMQGNSNRVTVHTPVNKSTSNSVRLNQLYSAENKPPVSRFNHPDGKTPVRGTLGQRVVTPGQQLLEGKIQSNQDKQNINPASPPDAKVFPNQVRTSQSFATTHETKATPTPRMIAPKPVDIKNSQIGSNKQTELKNTFSNRLVQSTKVTSDNKIRPNFIVKHDAKSINIPIVPESKTANSIRMGLIDSSGVRVIKGKNNEPVQMRLHPVTTLAGTPTSLHGKMVHGANVQSGGKVLMQGVKVAVSTPDMSQKPVAVFDVSPDSFRSPGRGGKRCAVSPAKKKCVKRVSPSIAKNASKNTPHGSLSPDDGNENGQKYISTLKSHRGLTITPVGPSTSASSSNSAGNSKISGENLDKDVYRIICPHCNKVTSNPKVCHVCKCNLNVAVQDTQQKTTELVQQNLPSGSIVMTEKTIVKKFIFSKSGHFSQAIQFNQSGQKNVFQIHTNPALSPRTGKPRPRTRRGRNQEPEMVTLSSDDEEHMHASFNSFMEQNINQSQSFAQESEASKSGQSSPTYPEDENTDFDDEFPGVTDINPQHSEDTQHYEDEDEEVYKEVESMEVDEEEGMGEDEELEEEDEIEEEEEEGLPPDEEEEEEEENDLLNTGFQDNSGMEEPLRCRSVRVGSYKIHPKTTNTYLYVYLSIDGLSFSAPQISDRNKLVHIVIKPSDITQMDIHFGRCLPIAFIYTTPSFAENIRKMLNMQSGEFPYFDPNSNDEKQKKITFLIDAINDDQKNFLRISFLADKKVQELDQKTANEILVKSTPNQQMQRVEPIQQHTPISLNIDNNQVTMTPVQPASIMRLISVGPPVPVTKLFTYPPPPQTGGIEITSEDLACLDEGEFLNDAIIDFYLKYVFYEKLSPYHREKTHIFSSYFFPRLTHKPERARPGDDAQKTLQARRHSQVKTWTRHVDIFSKDFIIIPVNQNVHWFLAIICYPGLVPEATESSLAAANAESNGNKSNDNVTSTDDQEESNRSSKESNSMDGSNPNLDENSTASSGSAFDNEELDSEETPPEAPDSSTHPDKIIRRKKEAPCICIFDSLNGPNRARIVTMLREYLEMEWFLKKGTRKIFDKTTMQGYVLQCPQQTNYSDCGIYLLQYVESFFESPIPYFDSPIPSLSNWFPKEKMVRKREELKELILRLQKTPPQSISKRKSIISENVSPSIKVTAQTDNR